MSNRRTPTTDPFAGWTIAEILARSPQVAAVFTQLRMACVGCPMAAFETPSEAAEAYGIAPEAMLAYLRSALTEQDSQFQSSSRGPKGRANRRRIHDT